MDLERPTLYIGVTMLGALDLHDLVRAAVALALVGAAASQEGRTRHIPNVLTLPAIPLAFALVVVDGRLADTGLGLLVSSVAALTLWNRDFLGGGGAKLAIALGAWVGLETSVIAWLAGALLVVSVRALHARVYPDAADRGAPTMLTSRLALAALAIALVLRVAIAAA